VRFFLAAACLLAAGVARADESAFYAAAALERDGRPAEAVEALLALVERDPGDLFADDALLESARILEERLADPVRAAALYERLARDYPASRLATRAQRRAEALRAALGPGGAHAREVAEMNAILIGFPTRSREESIARMEKLLASSPEFPDAPRAMLWLGTTLEGGGRRDEALARYREVRRRWPDGEWAARAARAEGDLLLARDELDAAEAAYRALSGEARDAMLTRVAVERGRGRLAVAAWIVLALAVAAALAVVWRRAGGLRPLIRPPAEVLYLLPVALLLAAAGLTENEALARAIAFVCAGGLVITWLSGAALEAARPVGRARLASHLVVVALAVAAVVYLAVSRERLIDFILETVRFGPER